MMIRCLLLFLFFSVTCRAGSYEDAQEAYIFGYPLVLMDVTKEIATNVAVPDNYHAPINQFAHARQLPDADFRLFPSPRVDTLSSNAWLDLSKGAFVLHLPTIVQRFFVVEVLDGWSNVIASLSPKTTGSNAKDFLITGPNFKDEVPENMTQISTGTNMVWIVGRTQVYGKKDLPVVRELQNQFSLTPLAFYGEAYTPPKNTDVNASLDMKTSPDAQVASMSIQAFFLRLAKLMKENPATKADAPMLSTMRAIGTIKDDPSIRDKALAKIGQRLNNVGRLASGWSAPLTKIGNYGTDYLLRAACAYTALGENSPSEVLTYLCTVDANGVALNGENEYRMHIAIDRIPPVNAFWSLTMYTKENYLVPNKEDRYSLEAITVLSYSTLQYNIDGTLDLSFQREKPDSLPTNWLPTPKGDFILVLRLYWPQTAALNLSYVPPSVILKTE